MSKSPLSGAFAESSATTKKKSKKNGAILLIAGIALTSSIGGVFAANSIIIDDVEFGQGAANTVSCTSNATTAITQEYVSDSFKVDEVTLTVTSPGDCSNAEVVLSLLGDNGTVLSATTARTGPAAGNSITYDFSGSPRISADAVRTITVTTE